MRLPPLIALLSSLPVSACAPTATATPACTNESSTHAYGDAGVVPPRALPNGYPCATGAVCYATVDNCPNDWPDAAAAPLSTSVATPFECACIGGVWSCEAETQTAPSCASPASPADSGSD